MGRMKAGRGRERGWVGKGAGKKKRRGATPPKKKEEEKEERE